MPGAQPADATPHAERIISAAFLILGATAWGACILLLILNLTDTVTIAPVTYGTTMCALLAAGYLGLDVAMLRGGHARILRAWRVGLHSQDLGSPALDDILVPDRSAWRGRPRVWRLFAHVATVFWTLTTGYITQNAMGVYRGLTDIDRMTTLVVLLFASVQATVIACVGPGRARIDAAYDVAYEAHARRRAEADSTSATVEQAAALAIRELAPGAEIGRQRTALHAVHDDDDEDVGGAGTFSRRRPASSQ